jgi:hypothetical protein
VVLVSFFLRNEEREDGREIENERMKHLKEPMKGTKEGRKEGWHGTNE